MSQSSKSQGMSEMAKNDNKNSFEVKLANHAGYCYGVERALKMAAEAVKAHPKPIYTLGPIIHNPQVVKSFIRDGVTPVDDISEVDEGTMIIRTHGVDPFITKMAKKRGLKVIDATCPFVAKAQKRAGELVREGYRVVIIGERDHPEVVGILAHAGGQALVVESVEDLREARRAKKIGIVVQTTQSLKKLREVLAAVSATASEVKVFNTICNATIHRQDAARELAKKADVMVVVGGKNSANTSRLVQICRETGTITYHLETAAELDPGWFAHAKVVGVTAGASTPERLLKEVAADIELIGKKVDSR